MNTSGQPMSESTKFKRLGRDFLIVFFLDGLNNEI